ncbi:MAG: recombination mediator RecR [Bacteriovoracaceae bacterium]|jgi:recombination protein RecR|nr:recombination protein RecR [Halobacteriovoraceae bacterium]MDP7321234.1 recombination mediator RecR [Bacteriovoracaceae bacterium]
MIELPDSILNTVKSFSKLPGVGHKTALRQVMSMVKWSEEDLADFSSAVEQLKFVKKCDECGMYANESLCEICQTESRKEPATLCVVETISDLMAIENSKEYSGLYHVLGGVLNPLLGVGPDQLKLDRIAERVNKINIENVVLAINPSVEGDATCSYIKQLLKDVNVERIGFGVPIGGSLEFLDPLTISKALENRKRL